ncbi:MAG: HAD-IA family hydrolase [Pseudomonadota bacterium]|nr:HAD-IA family hydrolase [Pseudomonadota bacterium]
MNQPPKLVIFDWDGTLMDSVGQIVDSLLHAATQYQIPLSADAAKNIIGLGLPEAMAALFPAHPHLHTEIQASYAAHYVPNSHRARLFDGVEDLLQQLHQQGTQLAVATGKSRVGLDRVLNESPIASLFQVTRCASETRSKPHPQMLEEILAVTGVAAADAVMVGDTSYDLDMAQQIQMPRIGVSYGVHSPEILHRYQPVAVVDDVSGLAKILR